MEDLVQQDAKRGQQDAKREAKSEIWWSKQGRRGAPREHQGATRGDKGRKGATRGDEGLGRRHGSVQLREGGTLR